MSSVKMHLFDIVSRQVGKQSSKQRPTPIMHACMHVIITNRVLSTTTTTGYHHHFHFHFHYYYPFTHLPTHPIGGGVLSLFQHHHHTTQHAVIVELERNKPPGQVNKTTTTQQPPGQQHNNTEDGYFKNVKAAVIIVFWWYYYYSLVGWLVGYSYQRRLLLYFSNFRPSFSFSCKSLFYEQQKSF